MLKVFLRFKAVNTMSFCLKSLFFCLLLFHISLAKAENISDENRETHDVSQITFDHSFQLPSEKIVDLFDRPFHPFPIILPNQDKLILRQNNAYMPYHWLSKETIQYAEIDIYPENRARKRSMFVKEYQIADISFIREKERLLTKDDFQFKKINLPEKGLYGTEILSPSNNAFLVLEYQAENIVLWHVDVHTLETKMLIDKGLTQAINDVVHWFGDQQNLLVSLIPDNLSFPSKTSSAQVGPIVMETSGKNSVARTFQNLLQNSYEEDLFEYYASSQLGIFNIQTGELERIGEPGLITHCQISPNGRFILIHEHLRPFSATLPYTRFPGRWYVYDIFERTSTELHRYDSVDLLSGWVQAGKRLFEWHPFYDDTLVYVIALDGGNPNLESKYRDGIKLLNYPFKGDGSDFFKTEQRFRKIIFIDKNAFVYEEFMFKDNIISSHVVNNDNRKHEIYRRHIRAIYDHPGSPMTYQTHSGHIGILSINNHIYFKGDGYSTLKRTPFIDRMDLENFQLNRIIEFDEEDHVNILDFYDKNPEKIILDRQNISNPRNLFLSNLREETEVPLTSFTDIIPEITKLKRQTIRYFRQDGVELSAILYLPENYDGTERLPLLMSAYPREFIDIETASQSTHNANTYSRPIGSANYYMNFENIAVLMDASFPIIGDTETVNNTFIEQNIMNAKAAIDFLDNKGIIDPNKVVVQGHSYGAFMVLNLLAHSDLFAGGIAQNGAYNRTLTPFGFQNERRTLWDAKDTYIKMSPFLYANQINSPLLLIHSTHDRNTGTHPMQSRRLFDAMNSNGKISRYVQLPFEGHHYVARETHLHILWEYKKFFDDHVHFSD